MTKKELRSLLKRKEREFLASGSALMETAAVWSAVEASPEFTKADTVLIYMDIPGEVPTRGFIERWRFSKSFVIPLVVGESLVLKSFDPDCLTEGYKGILEPSADAEDIAPDQVDLALVPGVAFSRGDVKAFPECITAPGEVFRMGRGKGFYDRLLPSLRCRCMAVGFSFRWLDELPLDPWDAALK